MKPILSFLFRIILSLLLIGWLIISGTIACIITLITFSPRVGMWLVRNIYCRGFHVIMGFTPTYSGLERIDLSKTYVLTANHESHMDTQSIFMSYPKNLHFIAKKELKYVPVVGWVIALLGMIFVDRSNSDKARKSMTKAAELIQSGKNVISFPEGTRTKDGEIKLFKKGLFALALSAEVDVVPVAVIGAREVMASGSLKLTPGPIHIAFGSPIDHNLFKDDPIGFSNAAREEVIKLKAHWTPLLHTLRA